MPSGKSGKSSTLGLRLTSKVSCHVIELSSIIEISKNYLPNGKFFGFHVVWSEGSSRSLRNMVYPINDYNLVLIGMPNSDNDVLAQLLQNPPGTPTVVEQLESAIKVAFGKN